MAADLRKPLYDAEKKAQTATVCITGGTGYIAGAIIKRLLAMGMTVNATVRDPTDEKKLAHLRVMPGAATRLHFFKATLEDATAFDAPLKGCKYLIHTASPVIMDPPKGQEREKLINPAIKGVENALNAATRAGTVERVVLTSSVAAVVGDNWERGRGHVFTEEDWDLSATNSYLPYHRSKLLAEQKAFELESQQKRWKLVTIQPPIVQGPPPGNIKCEVVGYMRKLMNGGYYPWAPPVGSGYVDIDDVAAAHTLGMVVPGASGRYIVSAASLTLPDYIDLLRPEYAMYKLPWLQVPWWLIWFNTRVLGTKAFDYDLLYCTHSKLPLFDCSKVKKELGLDFIDIRKTAQDMAQSLIDLGILPRLPGAPVSKL